MLMMSSSHSHEAAVGQQSDRSRKQRISDAISVAYKTRYGKGPESVKIHLTGDTVLAVLRGGFSIVEESLREAGETKAVRDQRRVFGDMIAPALGAAVGEVIERDVVAVLADTCQDPDFGAIVFILAPE